jgi:flagellar assembly protein FliH
MLNRWNPPSFDPPIPTGRTPDVIPPKPSNGGDALLAARHQAHQDAFARGLQEGLEEGRAQGVAMGRQEGYEKGHAEGLQAGFQQGYQNGSERLLSLTQSLQQLESQLKALPQILEPVLAEFVYQTALRIAGKENMDRTVFHRTVQEALMRLPVPGERLFLRVPEAELEIWTRMSSEDDGGLNLSVQADPSLQAGQAVVEVGGTRLDIGSQARQALVRSALGLLPSEFDVEQG